MVRYHSEKASCHVIDIATISPGSLQSFATNLFDNCQYSQKQNEYNNELDFISCNYITKGVDQISTINSSFRFLVGPLHRESRLHFFFQTIVLQQLSHLDVLQNKHRLSVYVVMPINTAHVATKHFSHVVKQSHVLQV